MKRDGSKTLLGCLGLVAIGAAALAWWSIRLAGRELDDGERRVRRSIEAEAVAGARRVGGAVTAAMAREPRATARIVDGRLGPASAGPEAPPPPAADYHRFARAIAGGRAFEFARNEPARALDAYAFYLPSIRDPALRTRLRFRVGRVAAATGRTDVAREAFRGVWSTTGIVEGGVPLDLAAGSRLLRDGELSADAFVARLTERRDAVAPDVIDAFLSLAPDANGDALRAWLASQRRLEHAFARLAGVLGERPVATDGADLLRIDGDRVAWFDLAPPPNETDALAIDVVAQPPADDLGPDRALAPVRIDRTRAPVAWVVAHDTRHAARLADLVRGHRTRVGLVVLLLVATLVGTGFAGAAIVRERRVARLREELLTNVTHELKTPITSIRLFSEMLATDDVAPADARRFGELMATECRRLGTLVEDVLGVARHDRTVAPAPRESVDVGALSERIAEGFRVLAERDGVRFDADPVPPMHVTTNAACVERIVRNLLDNALKYRAARDARITLRVVPSPDAIEIAVEDNGPGIPSREQRRIFEPFYRVRYDDYAVRGTGLGLSISRALGDAIGATLSVESRPDHGSRFVLRLPRTEDDTTGDRTR